MEARRNIWLSLCQQERLKASEEEKTLTHKI